MMLDINSYLLTRIYVHFKIYKIKKYNLFLV